MTNEDFEIVEECFEDLFEAATQVYNVPNTPLTLEGMNRIAQCLDGIKAFINIAANEEVAALVKIREQEVKRVTEEDATDRGILKDIDDRIEAMAYLAAKFWDGTII